MSVANNKWIKWQQVAGISVLCGLALVGCNRSDKTEDTETIETTEQSAVENNTVTPTINCGDPLVQDRLKTALKNELNQQGQAQAVDYGNAAEISLDNATVSSKINGIVINIQNATVAQDANSNGITTCQANVSMTLPSEDLYQASQVQAANNQSSLQSRLEQSNIRIDNNTLTDDVFTYLVAAQDGQVRVRITGQPALILVVSDVMASSVFKSTVDNERAQRAAKEAESRRKAEAAQNQKENQIESQPQKVTPLEPIRPVEPISPPTINQNNTQSSNTSGKQNAAPVTSTKPAAPVKDDSTEMVIVEDSSATY